MNLRAAAGSEDKPGEEGGEGDDEGNERHVDVEIGDALVVFIKQGLDLADESEQGDGTKDDGENGAYAAVQVAAGDNIIPENEDHRHGKEDDRQVDEEVKSL